jgi:hypothetical protein
VYNAHPARLLKYKLTGSSLNVFGDGHISLLSLFWTLFIVCFLKSLKNLKTLKKSLRFEGWNFLRLQKQTMDKVQNKKKVAIN